VKKILFFIVLFIFLNRIFCAERPYDASSGLRNTELEHPVYLPSKVVNRETSSGGIETWSMGVKKCTTWYLESEDISELIIKYYDQKFPVFKYDPFSPKMDYGNNKVTYVTPDTSLTVKVKPDGKFSITECTN